MKSRDDKEEAIGRSELSPAAQQHIDGCDDCRAFYADLQAIQTVCDVPVETPAFLRERTLVRCGELLREKTTVGESTLWQRWRSALDSPRFVAAAAIVGVAILITVTALQIDDAQDDVTNLSLKLTISQVVAQNILAALFLPALLLLKSGLVGVSLRETSSGD